MSFSYDALHESYYLDQPDPFERLTKVKGSEKRHIDQLWDEIKKLRYEVEELKKKNRMRDSHD